MEADKLIDKLVSDYKNEPVGVNEEAIADFIKLNSNRKKRITKKPALFLFTAMLLFGGLIMFYINIDNVKSTSNKDQAKPIVVLKSEIVSRNPIVVGLQKTNNNTSVNRKKHSSRKAEKVFDINNLVNTDLSILSYNDVDKIDNGIIDLSPNNKINTTNILSD